MSFKAVLNGKKRSGFTSVPARSLPMPRSFELPSTMGSGRTSAATGHDFSRLPVDDRPIAAGNCPLSLASPRACPFGGACHPCPARVQAKLAADRPGDEYEQKADRIAESVTRTAGTSILQRRCARCGDDDEGELQRKEAPGQNHTVGLEPEAQDMVQDVLHSGGRPLDPTARAFLEPRFGHDFGRVRVHTDGLAAESAHAVNALAYTVGRDIVFGAGQYSPTTNAGQRLLAHELAHTVQQATCATAFQPRRGIGAKATPAEIEADRVADRVIAGAHATAIQSDPVPALRREAGPQREIESEPNFDSPQPRGRRARATFIDAGRRGEDQVQIVVTRFLCDCVGRDVTRTRTSTRLRPRPGITLEFCRGRVTGRFVGEVEPSSLTTGRATLRGELNVDPRPRGTGARIGLEAELRNIGSEPQLGGRLDLRLRFPGQQQLGIGGNIFRGLESERIDWGVEAGLEIGRFRIGLSGTNLQDPARRGGMLTFGGPLPGQTVEERTCRECRCPIVYECREDILPRSYTVDAPYTVEDASRLRYYFRLDSNEDTRDSVLRGESTRTLGEVARRVAAGARIRSVTGYASPEDNRERPVPNEQLSLSRSQRLRSLLAARLGTNVQIPAPQAGGELLGRVPTIAPGSRLADAMLDVGFGGPEDVTTFLLGSDIPNPQLSRQFLDLLRRVTASSDRLQLFGIDSTSPAAPRLLAAIEQFVRNNGRGGRPWENVFSYLRFASVELVTSRNLVRREQRSTAGSLSPTPMSDAACRPYARRAESESRFGPTEAEPENESSCPTGEPRNLPEFAGRCDYDEAG